jgi:hypothetical protein
LRAVDIAGKKAKFWRCGPVAALSQIKPVDSGVFNGRAISLDGCGKVPSGKRTSQCAGGSGQRRENIACCLGGMTSSSRATS